MIEGVLLDLGGVVYVGDEPLSGALEALDRLRGAGLSLRYLTNTTRTPKRAMLDKLRRLGVPAEAGDLFMPALAARHHLAARGLSPVLLVHPALEEDFEGLPMNGPNAVIIGDAAQIEQDTLDHRSNPVACLASETQSTTAALRRRN